MVWSFSHIYASLVENESWTCNGYSKCIKSEIHMDKTNWIGDVPCNLLEKSKGKKTDAAANLHRCNYIVLLEKRDEDLHVMNWKSKPEMLRTNQMRSIHTFKYYLVVIHVISMVTNWKIWMKHKLISTNNAGKWD